MDTLKEIDFPPSEQLISSLLDEKVAVTLEGFGGKAPSSYCCNNELISFRRHIQSALVAVLDPLIGVNRSGNLEFVGREGLLESVVHVGGLGEIVLVVVVVEGVVVEPVPEEGVEVDGNDVGMEVAPSVPVNDGKHWEYISFNLTQLEPETQVVEPVHPIPPPCYRF
jgi:hypothetical protein